jgi:putative ABC transport system substrate-binding protein
VNLRRKLLVAIGAAPLLSFAQQGKVWRIGILVPRSRPASLDSHFLGAFASAMRELGYAEGKNVVIEWRFADGKYDRLAALAAELVELKVDVILAVGSAGVQAAQKTTVGIPIVMASVIDPLHSGFVASLAHPGGNITGLSNMSSDISPKHLEMLVKTVPHLSHVAVLMNPDNPAHPAILTSVQAAAKRVGLTVLPAEARAREQMESAFAAMAKQRAGAMVLAIDAFFTQEAQQIAQLAARNRLPSISGFREYAEAGGLMSYGQNLADNFRRAASYVDKILKGAKPGNLPVEQSTKFELVINRKTAQALGLAIPVEMLVLADRLIE